jgi:general stress protein YciG
MTGKANNKQNVGRGWHGNSDAHAKVGRLGGKATATQYGNTSFFHDIGSIGGRVSSGNFKNNPQRAKEAGKKGGRSRAGKRAGVGGP